MNCPKCQHKNRETARFCEECGAQLPAHCPACHAAVSPSANFCDACGHSLPASTHAASPPDSSSPSAPGERRHATVLFSDLSGYTAMNERLDPEEVQGIMRQLKDRAVEIVEAHGGMVNQFVGDEVLALFGIPTAHEDDPVRAVRAARELHEMVRALSPDLTGRIGRPLVMHTGINTGLVVTGTQDDRDGRVGITGDAVNVGARLKGLAEDNTILLSPETASLVEEFFTTEALGATALKGKLVPVTPHRVVGETAVRTRFEAATQRGLTIFTGRESELATLRHCLEKAVAANGQFVTIIGEAGVGKSRLTHEFCNSVDRDRVTILEGHCQSYRSETPYLPLLDALRRGLRIHDESDPATLHEKVVTNLLAIDPALERYLPHLLHLLSIPSDAHKLPETLQGEALRRELEEALAATITQSAQHQPTVLIYEDWHWADDASDSALNNIIGMVGHYPLMMIVLYRPEYTRKWAETEHYTAVVLHSLEVANTEAMLRSILGTTVLPDELAPAVHARTAGNALFNEEMAHALREEGIVAVDDGHANLTRPLDDVHLPDSIHAVIRTRVDRLDPADREVLRLASVIGREFDRAVLERIAPVRQMVSEALVRLARQDLIRQVRVLPQAEFIFKHVLTHVVVYETLLLRQRKELHAQIGQATEMVYANRLEEQYEALAHHFRQGADHEKALEYLEKAGDKAAGYSSLAEARSHYQAAIKLIEGIEDSTPNWRTYAGIAVKLGGISMHAASEELIEVLEKSQEYAQRLGEMDLVAKSAAHLGAIHSVMGNYDKAGTLLRQVIAMASELSDDEPVGISYYVLSFIDMWFSKFSQVIEYLENGIPMLRRSNNFLEGNAIALLALAYGWVGEFDKSIALFSKSFEAADRYGMRSIEMLAYYWRGAVKGIWGGNGMRLCQTSIIRFR